MSKQEEFYNRIKKIYHFLVLLFCLLGIVIFGLIYYMIDPDLSAFQDKTETYVNTQTDEDRIENGIHVRTGLIEAEGLMTVVNNCTNCHSALLVIQNRMNTERWITTIKWMQETQNLWDLGGNQEIIVNYLVTNYPPKEKGRREILTNIDWYELED